MQHSNIINTFDIIKYNYMKKELENKEADKYLQDNIEEAKTDFDKAVEVYKNYVGKAETDEERSRRIRLFRCGGYY